MSLSSLIPALLGAGAFLALGKKKVAFATTNPIFTNRFDGSFGRHCHGIPIPYLRALAKNESTFDPLDDSGPAWGLLQVTEVVRHGYNKRFRTDYSREDLLKTEINVKIACELIGRIAKTLPKKHPRALPRGVDWESPRFVEIVTLGWNAGYSEAAGIGRVLGILEQEGVPPSMVNIDTIHQVALRNRRVTRHLRNPDKVNWSRKVALDYVRQISVV